MTTAELVSYLDAIGIIANAMPVYEERPEQNQLAQSIESALADEVTLIAQGGCGVGKSFASLLPAIVSRKKTVYATATKALQDQIANKDLPFLSQHFDFNFAIVKGRSNYVCMNEVHNLDDELLKSSVLNSIESNPDMEGVEADFPNIDMGEWKDLTVSAEDCLGSACPFFENCFSERARQRAKTADIVVVNHSVLVFDALVASLGVTASGERLGMIGDYDQLIVDEAHELESYTTNALGSSLSEGTFSQLCSSYNSAMHRVDEDVSKSVGQIMDLVKRLFKSLPEGRVTSEFAETKRGLVEELCECLTNSAEKLSQSVPVGAPSTVSNRVKQLRRRFDSAVQKLRFFIDGDDDKIVRFVEIDRNENARLEIKPIHVGEWLNDFVWSQCTPVLMSATILIDGSPTYIADRLGIESGRAVDSGSPFDWSRQGILYVPSTDDICEPLGERVANWRQQSIKVMGELIEESDGGALVLFTSYTDMKNAYEALADSIPHRVLMQGDAPVVQLADEFRKDRNSVLFATRSFFTGMDIQGDSLRLVIISKMPFPVPTEPVFEARCSQIERNGGNAFFDMSIPEMSLVLQQGFGRLIRSKNDDGVVAILDPRLKTKRYGSTVLRSLPPVSMTSDLNVTKAYLRSLSGKDSSMI